MDAADLESILRAAQGGAEWAWSRLYTWLAADVRGYLRARGAASPDDVLGEVFVQLARNIDTFEGGAGRFRSWTLRWRTIA
jgi:RNA polymerase sigma-70 factor (ECF subfamily)